MKKACYLHTLLIGIIAVTTITGYQAAWAKADYFELSIGQGRGTLPEPQPDYEMSQLFATYGHHIDCWMADKTGWDPPGEWDVRFTPFAGFIDEPESNFEIGCTVGLRISKVVGKWRPFIYGATGPMYSTQGIVAQSTRLNFGSFAGAGLEYRLDEHAAIAVFRDTRHFSNGGVESPNDGVDTRTIGISYIWYE